jgi:hypothetical protein
VTVHLTVGGNACRRTLQRGELSSINIETDNVETSCPAYFQPKILSRSPEKTGGNFRGIAVADLPNTADEGKSVLEKWLYLVIRNAVVFSRLALQTAFHPSAVGRQIRLDHEPSFIRSLKFFLAATSTYLLLLSLLSYVLVNNTFAAYISSEVIFTSRQLFQICFQAVLFYFICIFVFRRSTTLMNIVHVWIYIGVATLILDVMSLVFEHFIVAPPLSAEMRQTLLSIGGPISKQCLQNIDGMSCRIWGQTYNISIVILRSLLANGAIKNPNEIGYYLIYVSYTIQFVPAFLLFVWTVLIETKIISRSLSLNPYLISLIAIVLPLGMVGVYYTIPELGYLFSDTGHSRGEEFQQIIKLY